MFGLRKYIEDNYWIESSYNADDKIRINLQEKNDNILL